MLSTKRDLGRGHLWLIGALRRSWSKAARADDPERRVTECEDPEAAVLTMRCRRRLATTNRRSKLAARLAGFSATRHSPKLPLILRAGKGQTSTAVDATTLTTCGAIYTLRNPLGRP